MSLFRKKYSKDIGIYGKEFRRGEAGEGDLQGNLSLGFG